MQRAERRFACAVISDAIKPSQTKDTIPEPCRLTIGVAGSLRAPLVHPHGVTLMWGLNATRCASYVSGPASKSSSKRKCFTLRPRRRTSFKASIPILICLSTYFAVTA